MSTKAAETAEAAQLSGGVAGGGAAVGWRRQRRCQVAEAAPHPTKHVLEKDTDQREINSHPNDEKERDGQLHSERNKALRDTMNGSSEDVSNMKLRAENGYNELNKALRDTMNGSSEDVSNMKLRAENGYNEPELPMGKDIENTNAKQLLEKDTH